MQAKKEITEKKKTSPYLTDQLITYIGNKRALLGYIGDCTEIVKKDLKKNLLRTMDVFSGSGIVSRYLKETSSFIAANDMENYARIISSCYLANSSDLSLDFLKKLHKEILEECEKKTKSYLDKNERRFVKKQPGFISRLYAPKDMDSIEKGERCFYTPYNACYIDIMRQLIEKKVPEEYKAFFIAPLLSEASVHANTGGVFKGFYKNSNTGCGKFGGNKADALSRITGKISLPFPIFSSRKTEVKIFMEDANLLASREECPQVDLAYIDPPYNQHPYGSNYFMLNLIASYEEPPLSMLSRVSGIPKDWNRSLYNKKSQVKEEFFNLVKSLKAKYLLISFNSEGFISLEEMLEILETCGKVSVFEIPYNAYRASRNLSGRAIHVKEYLYLVKKAD